jgi:DNA (cytosine-5)-methyltransferase 1
MPSLTDIFAGGGGSSTGATLVPGVHVALSANHWPLAVRVHAANHPNTIHACVDLHLEDPRNFPHTDMLWASPECTKWSIANSKAKELSVSMGGDPTLFDDVPDDLISEGEDEVTRSRLLMFDVLRFIEYHRYRVVVVENVVDIATLPKYAAAWTAWRLNLRKLGYQFRVVSLNSMHAQAFGLPAPQSRDRLYILAWPETETAPNVERILRPQAWCPRCERVVESRQAWKPGRTVGRYRAQYVYVCGTCATAVEPGWLPASTAIDWSIEGQLIGERERPLSPKTMARIREGLRRYGHEFIAARDLSSPLSTITANETSKALILEAAGNTYDAADPNHAQYGQAGAYYRVWPTSDPLRTLHGTASKALLVPTEGRDGKHARPASSPLRTQTTRNELGILTMLRGTNAPKLTDDVLDTLAAGGFHHGLLVPSGGTWHETAYPSDAPMRTVTTRENHGLLVPYYSGSETAKPTSNPIGTLTTVDRYALVMDNNHSNRHRPTTEPLPTQTTATSKALLEPTTIDPNDCTFRMLEPHEIAAGMAFPATYQWEGTKRERVRLAGNAVTPPAARDIVTAISEGLDAA